MSQFSLRDLLFLVVIVALALGWLFDRRPRPARYQVSTASQAAFMVDTTTGEVWIWSIDNNGYLKFSQSFKARE